MSQQQSRKRLHQSASTGPVKEEPLEQQQTEEETNSIAGGDNGSFYLENSNAIGNGGNSGDNNELNLKVAALEAKNQTLESRLENQELKAQLHAISEQNILSNLKEENRALWKRLAEVEENARADVNNLKENLQSIEDQQKASTAAVAATMDPPMAAATMDPPISVALNPQQQKQQAKLLGNTFGNCWNTKHIKATMLVAVDGLCATNNCSLSDNRWGNIYARTGFSIDASVCRQDNFEGPILYYFEIANKTPVFNQCQFCIGFCNGSIKNGTSIGCTPNTYAMPENCDYCILDGTRQNFEDPNGATVKPRWDPSGNIVGCGLLLDAGNKLAIFFTSNGKLMGKQMPIFHVGNILYPTACLNRGVTLEANFGAKPYKYNIDKCPGLTFQ